MCAGNAASNISRLLILESIILFALILVVGDLVLMLD